MNVQFFILRCIACVFSCLCTIVVWLNFSKSTSEDHGDFSLHIIIISATPRFRIVEDKDSGGSDTLKRTIEINLLFVIHSKQNYLRRKVPIPKLFLNHSPSPLFLIGMHDCLVQVVSVKCECPTHLSKNVKQFPHDNVQCQTISHNRPFTIMKTKH